jgi:hypothetical protein
VSSIHPSSSFPNFRLSFSRTFVSFVWTTSTFSVFNLCLFIVL